jgi:Beta-propeller repeat
LDSSGDAYLVGLTYSTDFPTHNPIQGSLAGASNGFVAKLNSSGNALVYSTYLGGGTGDFAAAVALDSSDNAYVTGATQNPSFPTTTGAFQTTCGTAANCNGGLSDAFVSVIKADGSGFVYSTFLGGGGADQGLGIAVDSSGDAYVTGLTQSSTDFPTKSPIQASFGGVQDAFVSALNPSGSALLYSTYLGGSQSDAGAGIAVDGNKNAYVTGQTGSSNFPIANATQSASGGGNDAFITEINAAGSKWVFSTYLGGSGNENSTASLANTSALGAIALDSAGANVYVAGNTASTNFPTVNAKQGASGGGTDAFIAKYLLSGTSPNFTVTNGSLSATSGNPGASATATITVTSVGGFNSAVNLACTVAPVVTNGPTCTFSNPGASVTPPANGTVTAALNIGTIAASAALQQPSNRRARGILFAMLFPVAGVTLLGAGIGSGGSRRRKLFGVFVLVIVLAGLLVMPACGGSSGGGGGGGGSGTPANSYTFAVTGTAGGTVNTGSPALTFTVN